MGQPISAGGLLTTELERFDLGTHGGIQLTARVERRMLRIGFGHVRLTLARLRPTAVEATRDGVTRAVRVPVPVDPWIELAVRVAVATAIAFVLPPLVRRRRRARASSTRE